MAKIKKGKAATSVSMNKTARKSMVKKAKFGGTLTKSELDALAHQRRGMGDMGSTFVKKSGPIMNELGKLTPAQQKQLKDYMNKESFIKKVYEGLPNIGRIVGRSAADIPKNSQLQKQRRGGTIKSKKK